MEINNPAYTDFFFKVFWRQLLGLGCFKRLQLLQTTVCNLIVERLLPTQEILLKLTSYVDFYWLREHFVLRPTLRILEVKPAIYTTSASKPNAMILVVRRQIYHKLRSLEHAHLWPYLLNILVFCPDFSDSDTKIIPPDGHDWHF
jgi:hypothetical protein